MAKRSVRVVNKSEQRLPIPWGKSTIIFAPRGQPGSVQDLPEDAAAYCQGHYGEMLGIIEPSARIESLIEVKHVDKCYVANMTGDPDAPEFVGEYFNLRTKKNEKELNDNKQPQELRFRLGRFNGLKEPGTWRFKGDNGWEYNSKPVQVTTPGRMIKIAPYSRVEVTKEQKETILSLDMSAPESLRGRIIESRAPSDFEPNFDDDFWTLDNMRTWLELIPGSGAKPMGRDVIGKSEAEIRAEVADEDEAEVAVNTARFDMWTRCTLRAQDPQFRLPTRKDFDASVGRKAKAAKQAAKKETQATTA